MKKTGTSACSDATVCNQGMDKFAINSASGVVYNLLDL